MKLLASFEAHSHKQFPITKIESTKFQHQQQTTIPFEQKNCICFCMSLTIFYSRARTLQIPGSYSGVGTNFAHISASDYAYFVYRFIFFSFSSRFLIIIILCCSASLHQMWRCIFCHSATHMKSHKMPINNFVLLASFHSPITYKKILVLLHTDKHRTNRAQQSTLNSKIVQSDQRHHIHFQLYRNSALQEHQVN